MSIVKKVKKYCNGVVILTPLHGRLRCMHAAGTKPRRIADSAPVTSRRPLTRRNQHDAAGALAGARRRSDVTHSNGIDAPTHSPLCASVTSSIKPEVHNVSQQRRWRRTITSRPNNNNSTYRVAMHNTVTQKYRRGLNLGGEPGHSYRRRCLRCVSSA